MVFAGNPLYQPAATLCNFSFSTAQNAANATAAGFSVQTPASGIAYTDLWHLETSRRQAGGANHSGPSFYFGNPSGNYDVGYAGEELVTPTIDLTSEAANSQTILLSFDYLLQTENSGPAGNWDVANVFVEELTSSGWQRQPTPTSPAAILSNTFAIGNQARLNDRGPSPTTVPSTASWDTATSDLSGYRNQQIRLVFQFLSGDNLANNYEGWYVDDVTISRLPTSLTAASAAATLPGSGGVGYGKSVAVIGATVRRVVQDFTGDHFPDIAVLTKNGTSGSISIYAGRRVALHHAHADHYLYGQPRQRRRLRAGRRRRYRQ